MDCERIAYQTAEYMGKRLINRPAKFAGDATLKAKPRLFGTYVPDNDGYQYCVSTYKRELKEKYGYKDRRSAVQLPARHQPLPRPGGPGVRRSSRRPA